MGTWFWINVPLMVLAFALTAGLSYALLLRPRRPATGAPPYPPPPPPRLTVRTRPAVA